MVHKPKHKVHSFRGLLGDGGQDEINLERQNVNLAYRVVKFEIIAHNPGTTGYEHVVKIYRESQTSIDAVIDFSNTDLIGAAFLQGHSDSNSTEASVIVFDNMLFSRDIYVNHVDTDGSLSCNYYIELEEVPVNAATLMQLKLGVARKLNLSQNAPD